MTLRKQETTKQKCKHNNAYFFHDNAPMYCPDCDNYIDGGQVIKLKKQDEKQEY